MILHAVAIRPLTSHSYKAETQRTGVSPDQRGGGRRRVLHASHATMEYTPRTVDYIVTILPRTVWHILSIAMNAIVDTVRSTPFVIVQDVIKYKMQNQGTVCAQFWWIRDVRCRSMLTKYV